MPTLGVHGNVPEVVANAMNEDKTERSKDAVDCCCGSRRAEECDGKRVGRWPDEEEIDDVIAQRCNKNTRHEGVGPG